MMKLISAHRIFCLWLAMLSCVAVFAGSNDDTLWPKNSLRLEIAGKAIVGVGITYERAWINSNRINHARAFNSIDVNVSFSFLEYIMTSLTFNRNWYLDSKEKWTLSAGITPAALISLSPTPKEIREYYDTTHLSRGRYVNPVEPWLLANLSCRYTFQRMFVQASATPFIYYDRAYNNKFVWAPWGGVSVGFNLATGNKTSK